MIVDSKEAGPETLTPLRHAVEEAYRLFKAEPPDHWSGDDMDLGKEDWARLTNVPLRELNRSDTNHFLSETGEFTRHEVRYMLPRVMDLLADGEAPHAAGEECSLRCLAEAGYPENWTLPEQMVVEAFLAAMIDECLSKGDFVDGFSLDTLLCMASNANADVAALLNLADQAAEKSVTRAVAFDFSFIGGLDEDGNLVNAFWETVSPEHRSTITAWYRRPELAEMMERAFFAETDPEWQRQLSDAAEVMRTWRSEPATASNVNGEDPMP